MSRPSVIFLLILIGLAGCEQSSKLKDPVAPPPPRRSVPPATANEAAQASPDNPVAVARAGSPLQSASHTSQAGSSQRPVRSLNSDLLKANPDTLMLARAGGKPIFLRDVLDNVGSELAADHARLAPEQFRAAQHERIAEGLRMLVERELMLQQAARELKEPQLKLVRNAAEKDFEKRVRTLMQQMGVSTEEEVNARLVKNGMSLKRLRQTHQDNFVSQQFLRSKVTADVGVSRPEMLAYYHEHIDAFTDPPRVKWQQLTVPCPTDHLAGQTNRCRCAGCEQARRLRAQLEAGADFDELARRSSAGPRKEDGGRWDWTPQGSLADPLLNTALFALAPGPVSPVLEGTDALHIIRVLEKDPGGVRPFRAVQQEVRTNVRTEKLQKAADEYLATLYEKTEVEYMFSDLAPARVGIPIRSPEN